MIIMIFLEMKVIVRHYNTTWCGIVAGFPDRQGSATQENVMIPLV